MEQVRSPDDNDNDDDDDASDNDNVTVQVGQPPGAAGRCLGTSVLVPPLGTLHVVVGIRAGGARTGDGTRDTRVGTGLLVTVPGSHLTVGQRWDSPSSR